MDPEDRGDRSPIDVAVEAVDPLGDPVRLGLALEIVEVVLAAPGMHGDHGDEPAASNEPDEEQPPLERSHQPGRIGRTENRIVARLPGRSTRIAAYTPRR